MRVLAVAEDAVEVQRWVQGGGKIGYGLSVFGQASEVAGDGAVVGRGVGEGLAAKLEAQGLGNLAAGFDLGQHAIVVGRIDHHGHALVVLGRRTHHGRAADVDVLDDVLEGSTPRDGLAEGIEVDHHEVDGVDAVIAHLFAVLVGGAAKDAAVHARVQGLDPAIEHLGKAGEVAHVLHGDLGLAQRTRGAASGENLDAQLGQALAEIQNAFLVRYRNQSPSDLLHERILTIGASGFGGLGAKASATMRDPTIGLVIARFLSQRSKPSP